MSMLQKENYLQIHSQSSKHIVVSSEHMLFCNSLFLLILYVSTHQLLPFHYFHRLNSKVPV